MGRAHRPGRWGLAAWVLAAWVLAGCADIGPPRAAASAHHHVDGFANQTGVTGTDPGEFLADRLRLLAPPPDDPPAPILPPGRAALRWAATGEADAVQWLGHATVLIRLAGTVAIVDPVFAERVSPIEGLGPRRASPPPYGPATLPAVDAILVSHDHYDHFEPATIRAIAARDAAVCLLPLGVGAGQDLGCTIRAMDWWDGARRGGMSATLVPAQHESGRSLFGRDATLWGAWLLEGGGRRIFVSGDTGYGPHFAAIGQRSGPIDLAILSVGGYEPRAFNRFMHITPEEAVRALVDLRADRALIVHWGTYPLGGEQAVETVERMRVAAAAAGRAEDVLFLAIGEILPF